DAGALGQDAHGFGEGQAVLAHEEAEGIASHAAAEAVEDAPLGIDGERRGLLGVEGAEALPVLAGFFQVHEAADELDDVHPRADLVEDGRGEAARHQLCPSMATVAPAPPSWPSPARWLVTSGWETSSSSTARRRAPVPLPWMMRTWARPARKASSRYFSSRSRASSVVRPMRWISGGMVLDPAPSTLAPSPCPLPRGGRGLEAESPVLCIPLPSGERAG